MKNFNFFLTTTTILLIFLPFLVNGQTDNLINCSFSEPLYSKKVGDITTLIPPDATNVNFQYSKMNCSSTLDFAKLTESIEKIDATNSSSTFWLDKSWTYGELFIAFLLVLILFFTIFFIVFNFFFEPVFKIRGKQ